MKTTWSRRRMIVAAVTVTILMAFTALVGWQADDWLTCGWAGFTYAPTSALEEEIPWLGDYGTPGFVLLVEPASPAGEAGVVAGDRILTVNGVPISDTAGLRRLADTLQPGDLVAYEIGRNDEAVLVELRLGSLLRSPYVAANGAATLLVGIVFLLISVLVYWSRPESSQALVFYIMCTAGSAAFLLWTAGGLYMPDLRGILPAGAEWKVWVVLLGYWAISQVLFAALLHLSLIFPRPRPIFTASTEVLGWVYSLPFLPIVVLLCFFAGLISVARWWSVLLVQGAVAFLLVRLVLRLARVARRVGIRSMLLTRPFSLQAVALLAAGVLGCAIAVLPPLAIGLISGLMGALYAIEFLLLLLAYAVLTCINLVRSYRASGVEEKRQVRWPLWGTVTALVSYGLLVVVSLTVGTALPAEHPARYFVLIASSVSTTLVFLLIPVSFAFAILKHRLLEIDLIISRTVVYGGVTAFVLLTYLLTAGLSGLAIVSAIGVESQSLAVVATLLVAVLFVPVRNRLQTIVDRRLLRRRSDTELRRRVREAVLGADRLDELVPQIADELHAGLRCRSVVILVRAHDQPKLVAAAKVGLPDALLGQLSLSTSSEELGVHDSQIVHLDREAAPALQELVLSTRAVLAAIARLQHRPVGLIAVGSRLDGERLDDEDERLLIDIADQLSLAIGNLQRRRAEVEAEQARVIQQSLLPDELPTVPGLDLAAVWQPAREVSGDYYDVLDLGDEKLAVCIGDVVGKGMPAALLMSSLQAAVKAVASAQVSPREVCERVRRVVCQSLTGGKFVTFFYAVIDSQTGALIGTNMGHNPPLLARHDQLEELATGGPVLTRMLRDAPIEQATLELRPGDRLVLFTDGVTEAMSPAGEMYGEDRLRALILSRPKLDATGLRDLITSEVAEFAANERSDDLTLVVIRRTES